MSAARTVAPTTRMTLKTSGASQWSVPSVPLGALNRQPISWVGWNSTLTHPFHPALFCRALRQLLRAWLPSTAVTRSVTTAALLAAPTRTRVMGNVAMIGPPRDGLVIAGSGVGRARRREPGEAPDSGPRATSSRPAGNPCPIPKIAEPCW